MTILSRFVKRHSPAGKARRAVRIDFGWLHFAGDSGSCVNSACEWIEAPAYRRNFGVAPQCYHTAVPTRFIRIPVTKDQALAEALDRVAPLIEPDRPAASLVHDLAIRGAEAMLAERQQDAEGIERLIEHSTSTDPGFDVDIAQRIDELAWGK